MCVEWLCKVKPKPSAICWRRNELFTRNCRKRIAFFQISSHHILSKFPGKTEKDVQILEQSKQLFRLSIKYKIATEKGSENMRMRNTPLHFMNGWTSEWTDVSCVGSVHTRMYTTCESYKIVRYILKTFSCSVLRYITWELQLKY